jgi:hypothetical protein
MPTEKHQAYLTTKSNQNIREAQSEYAQRRDAYIRDCEALEMVQASRPSKPGKASLAVWMGLYGRRVPYRAVMRQGQVVLA